MNLEQLEAELKALGYTNFKFETVTYLEDTSDPEITIDRRDWQLQHISAQKDGRKMSWSFQVNIGADKLVSTKHVQQQVFKSFLNKAKEGVTVADAG